MVPASQSKEFIRKGPNTKYFHLVANGKHRKTRIFRLEWLIQGDTKLKKYITTYYKKLFSPSNCNLLSDG